VSAKGIRAGEDEALAVYPVEPGHVWGVGPHRFVCADAEGIAGALVAELAGRIDMVWTDPPYTAGQGTMYRTISGVDGEVGRKVEWDHLADCLVACWARCDGDVWLGTAATSEALWTPAVERAGGVVLAVVPTVFATHDTIQMLIRFSAWDRPMPSLPFGVHADKCAEFTMEASLGLPDDAERNGRTVTDFCTGRGKVPRAAAVTGHRYVGSELSPGRMAVALVKQAALIGEAAVRVA
jgi:hypothetical protein